LAALKDNPVAYADEALLWLATSTPASAMMREPNPESHIAQNESLWIKILPVLAKQTSRPEQFVTTFQRIASVPPGMAGGGGMGGGGMDGGGMDGGGMDGGGGGGMGGGGMGSSFGGTAFSPELSRVAIEAYKIAQTRVNEMYADEQE
jgi:hypothetical protein